MFNADKNLMEKWGPVLDHESVSPIQDNYKKAVTARLLENQEVALQEERNQAQGNFISEAAAANNIGGGNIGTFDPVLISLVRRAMPNLIAYDIAGVQPMSGPTGLIFAMKSKYSTQGGTEALYDEADTDFSGTGTHQADPTGLSGVTDADTDATIADEADTVSTFGSGLATSAAERLGVGESGDGSFGEMAFSIEKSTVTAKSRALKAEYTMELAQDLKAIHGLDAEGELANILSAEILAEINREVVRTILTKAKIGALQTSTAVSGIFDVNTDSDGRWMVERFKGLIKQIERECNVMAKETRRGKGNFIYYKVYIDPYATTDFVCVGYSGTNPYDAGMFYCPYVPLTMVKAVGENDFQPRMGFKTRYGMVANPFVAADGVGTNRANQYFRIFRVDDIMV